MIDAAKMVDENLQYGLVGALLSPGIDRDNALEFIKLFDFKGEYLTVPELRTAYDILIASKSMSQDLLIKELLPKVSADTCNKAVQKGFTSRMDVQEAVSAIKDRALKDQIVSYAVKLKNDPHVTASFAVGEMRNLTAKMEKAFVSKAESDGISLDQFADPKPEEEDPNCIFHGRFLEKGDAMVLAAAAGVGKSTITMQFAYPWALGRELFGIRPLRSLKIGIFQTEDSNEITAETRTSMREGFKCFHKWTADDIKKAEESIFFHDPKGRMDDAFVSYLRETQQREHYDLVIINPLSGVTTIDISNNTEMNKFLCEQLDPIIKHDADTKCGLIIVHHTNKPQAASGRPGCGTDTYAQYDIAGAAKLTNWMRSMLSIKPVESVGGQFKLVAAKKGERLGWPKDPAAKNHKPTRLIRYSTREEGIIFWHEVEGGVSTTETASKVTIEDDAKRLAKDLKAEARTLTAARQYAKDLFKRSRGDAVYDAIVQEPEKYGLTIKPTGKASQTIIGSAESVEKYFSTLKEEEAAAMRAKLAKMEAPE